MSELLEGRRGPWESAVKLCMGPGWCDGPFRWAAGHGPVRDSAVSYPHSELDRRRLAVSPSGLRVLGLRYKASMLDAPVQFSLPAPPLSQRRG